MSAFMISLFFAAGASGWVYTKFYNKTGGGNQKSVIIGTALSGVVLFFVIFSVLKWVLHVN